ncbi:MAG: glycoside hydrolase family 15 protein [Acidimicrobiia bacterium]
MDDHTINGFTPVESVDGYLPLEDHGLIGDGSTAGLVGRDGAVSWLCIPRFDSPPLFCRILDAARGGAFAVAPDSLVASRQRYEPDTGVLITELRGPEGTVRVTDALTLRAGADLAEDAPAYRRELIRSVVVLDGRVRLRVEVDAFGGARAERRAGGLQLICPRPDLDLQLEATRPLDGLRTAHDLEAGDRLDLILRWCGGPFRHSRGEPERLLRQTVDAWRRWITRLDYQGPGEPQVRRSAITLKLLDHVENGALVAAPTSSLPETIGGVRNWDYRYAWIRDAAFSVYALHRIGLSEEAWGFMGWALDTTAHGGRPRVLYDLDGAEPPPEREDDRLEGYRGSRPVRWGNAAADQRQHASTARSSTAPTNGSATDARWTIRSGLD